jgi:hypothetical protein
LSWMFEKRAHFLEVKPSERGAFFLAEQNNLRSSGDGSARAGADGG